MELYFRQYILCPTPIPVLHKKCRLRPNRRAFLYCTYLIFVIYYDFIDLL